MTRISQWRATTQNEQNPAQGSCSWILLGFFFLLSMGALGIFIYAIFDDPYAEVQAVAQVPTQTSQSSPIPTTVMPTQTMWPSATEIVVTVAPITATDTREIPPTFTPTASHTPVPVPTRYISPTPGGSARIEGFVGNRQSLPLSCEASAAVDWAAFYGVQIDELEFLGRIPLSDNPDKGFVGDVNGSWGQIPPQPYGVHAAPVALILQTYGLPAQAVTRMSWEMLKAEISAGNPVIVWVAGHVARGTPEAYIASDGYRTIVTRFEHTVVVTGYSEENVWIVDGAREYTRTVSNFLDSWGVLRNMAVVWGQ